MEKSLQLTTWRLPLSKIWQIKILNLELYFIRARDMLNFRSV